MQCEVCVQGKFTPSRNRKPDVRTRSTLELVHRFSQQAREGYRYALFFFLQMTTQVLCLCTF